MQSSTIFTLAGLAALVNGHMKMKSPAPFDPTALTNAPLDASGSDFPCKFGSGYSATGGTTNTYALGSKQTLSFIGQATHGGGSCQVSITYDTTPTKSSKWKVIHSIEGGCPAKGVSGNMGDSADADDPYTYPYTIPSNIPAGKATIAWTWFNKVGNREMYMNCGALELTGTGGSQSDFDALPDMLVLNIGGAQTIEGYDYAYENPGSSVEDNTSSGTVATCGTSGCTPGKSSSSGSSGSGSSGSGSSAASSAAAATSAAAPASSAASSAGAGGVFITQSPSAGSPTSAAAASPTTAAASSATSAAAPAATSAASSGSGSSTSSGSALTGACSPEGTFNCMGSTYQQCASGQWSVTMQMAQGTTCSAGQGTTLNIAAIGKRLARFFKA